MEREAGRGWVDGRRLMEEMEVEKGRKKDTSCTHAGWRREKEAVHSSW